MGVPYEINWYIVIGKQDDIKEIEKNKYKTIKDGQRIYPISASLPLIIKNIGCIGLAKILNFKVGENLTELEFELIEKYSQNNEIANHYYNMYTSMK